MPAGASLETYVYLDPTATPREVMLHFQDATGSWEHRVFWSASAASAGPYPAQRLGDLPPAGRWVRLLVPAAAIGLEGRAVQGVTWSTVDGRAWFDRLAIARPGLGPGWEFGAHLSAEVSVASLVAYDANGEPLPPTDTTSRIDWVEVIHSDGDASAYRNTAPAGSWPSFTPPEGESSLLSRNPSGSWTFTTADGTSYRLSGDGGVESVEVDENQGGKPALRYSYDASMTPARLIAITDPLDRSATFGWNGDRLVSVTGWDRRVHFFGHDPHDGRLTLIQTPAGRRTRFGYVGGDEPAGRQAGLLAAVTSPRGTATRFSYGDGSAGQPADRVVLLAEPAGAVTRYRYGPASTDVLGPRCPAAGGPACPHGYTVRVEYDGRNRPVGTVDAAGHAARRAYDAADRPLVSVDQTGARRDTTYDDDGRAVATIDAPTTHAWPRLATPTVSASRSPDRTRAT